MVLTRALEAYGKFLKPMAIIVLPAGILAGLILLAFSNSRNEILQIIAAFNVPGWIISPLWVGPLIYGLSLYDAGQEFEYKKTVGGGLKPWWKLMLCALAVIGIKSITAVGGHTFPQAGSLFLVLTGVIALILLTRYILILPLLVLEERSLRESLGRSGLLSKGKRLNILFEFIALWILLYVVVFIMQIIIGQLANFIGGMTAMYIFFVVVTGVIQPMLMALIVVWIYYFYLEQDQAMAMEA